MDNRALSAVQLNNTTPPSDGHLQWAIDASMSSQHAEGAPNDEALQWAIDASIKTAREQHAEGAPNDEALQRAIDASIKTVRKQHTEKVPTDAEKLRQTALKFSRQQEADLVAARRKNSLLAAELAAEREKSSLLAAALAAALKENNRLVRDLPLAPKPEPLFATEIIDIMALAAGDHSPPANVTTPLPDTDQPSAEEQYWPFFYM